MLTISSNPNNILEVESYLKKLDFDFRFDKEKYADILISLTEAVNNAIIHGNNIECCGGRGVYIMKALADDISFDDNGSKVEMYFDLKTQSA